MPINATVTYTDGSTTSAQVQWDENALANAIAAGAGQYEIAGTVSVDSKQFDVTCTLTIKPQNLLANPGFEDADMSVWTITDEVGSVARKSDANNVRSGSYCLHFWAGSDFAYTVQQTVTLQRGVYTFGGFVEGGDVGDNAVLKIYVNLEQESLETLTGVTGWQNWANPEVEFEVFKDHTEIQVGLLVNASAGGWGAWDDMYIYRIGDIQAETPSTGNTNPPAGGGMTVPSTGNDISDSSQEDVATDEENTEPEMKQENAGQKEEVTVPEGEISVPEEEDKEPEESFEKVIEQIVEVTTKAAEEIKEISSVEEATLIVEKVIDALEIPAEVTDLKTVDSEIMSVLKELEAAIAQTLGTKVEVVSQDAPVFVQSIENALISMPAGGSLISGVSDADVETLPVPEELSNKQVENAVAIELSLVDMGGNKRQPDVPVVLTFVLPESIDESKEVVVLHYLDETRTKVEVLHTVVDGNQVKAVTNSFSTFVIANVVSTTSDVVEVPEVEVPVEKDTAKIEDVEAPLDAIEAPAHTPIAIWIVIGFAVVVGLLAIGSVVLKNRKEENEM